MPDLVSRLKAGLGDGNAFMMFFTTAVMIIMTVMTAIAVTNCRNLTPGTGKEVVQWRAYLLAQTVKRAGADGGTRLPYNDHNEPDDFPQ